MDLITTIQFDPNGFCNAKCWYCPVRYEKLPDYSNMSVKDMTTIFNKIVKRMGNEVSIDISIYTAHYNEILLYPHLKEFFEILRERKLKTVILSNGTNLTPEKYDLILQYRDVINGVNLNIPAIEVNEWVYQVGLPKDQHVKLLNNLNYIHNNINKIAFSIGMNGIEYMNMLGENGYLGRLSDFPDVIKEYTLNDQFNLFKEMYPNFDIYMNTDLVDRNNILEKNEIYSLKIGNLLYNKKDNTQIVGCNNGEPRFKNWLHINCKGDVFVCCNDYNYEYVFGNIIEQPLEEIWNSDKRKNVIQMAKNNMCQTCKFAVWSK